MLEYQEAGLRSNEWRKLERQERTVVMFFHHHVFAFLQYRVYTILVVYKKVVYMLWRHRGHHEHHEHNAHTHLCNQLPQGQIVFLQKYGLFMLSYAPAMLNTPIGGILSYRLPTRILR